MKRPANAVPRKSPLADSIAARLKAEREATYAVPADRFPPRPIARPGNGA